MIQNFELLDRTLLLKINGSHTPILNSLMWQISESWHTYLFVFVVAFIFYRKFNLKKAVELVLGVAIVVACSDFSSNIIKHQVKRYRPSHNLEIKQQINSVNDYKGGKFGFVSSHAANGFGITTFLFLSLFWLKKKTRVWFFIYPFLIAYSRIYLGVHYPSDVIVGAIIGVVFALIVFKIMNQYFFKLHEKT